MWVFTVLLCFSMYKILIYTIVKYIQNDPIYWNSLINSIGYALKFNRLSQIKPGE